MNYLKIFGYCPAAVVAPKNFTHTHAGYEDRFTKEEWNDFSSHKCIVTARDPYLCAIRFLHNGQTVEECASHWNIFLNTYEDFSPFILDVGTREGDRLEHLYETANFIDECPDKYEKDIREYADAWIPVKGSNSEMKQQYLEYGTLPANHSWQLLDEAVEWYRSLPTNDE
jgi:hypothetical protein